MNCNEQQTLVKGALIGFCGDTLDAHEFAGFEEGVGFTYQIKNVGIVNDI